MSFIKEKKGESPSYLLGFCFGFLLLPLGLILLRLLRPLLLLRFLGGDLLVVCGNLALHILAGGHIILHLCDNGAQSHIALHTILVSEKDAVGLVIHLREVGQVELSESLGAQIGVNDSLTNYSSHRFLLSSWVY